jgi:hypothetical protein
MKLDGGLNIGGFTEIYLSKSQHDFHCDFELDELNWETVFMMIS